MRSELRQALGDQPAWIVGGAVRDRLLGRPTKDFDVALEGDPERAALSVRKLTGGAVFPLSKSFAGWRVVAPSGGVDLLPLTGGTLERDLAARDFTVNAIAEPVGDGELVDPHGGVEDLEARVLRPIGPESFTADPVRVLRLVRLSAELGLEPLELAAARAAAPALTGASPERIFAELKRIVLAGADAVRLLIDLGVEIRALDADRLDRLDVPGGVADLLAEPLADDLTRGQALRLAAALPDGDALRRLRASARLVTYCVKANVAAPAGDARSIHRWLLATAPWSVDAAILGGGPLDAALAGLPAAPLVRGDELDVPPGPEVGRLLARLEEDRYAGEIATRDEALDRARQYLGGR